MKRSVFIFITIICFLLQANIILSQQKLDIFLVLDNSGSMKSNDPDFLTREVVKNFINTLGKTSRLGMVIFDAKAQLAEPLAMLSDKGIKEKFLKSLEKVNYKGLLTNSPAGIERAIYELKNNGREDVPKIIIFLTDGIVDTGNKKNDEEKVKWLKEELAQDSKKAGIRIFGIAFTEKADFSLIQSLALKTDGQYYRAYKAEEINGVFNRINEVITKPKIKKKIKIPAPQTKVKEIIKEKTPAPPEEKKLPINLIFLISSIVLVIIILFLIFRKKPKPVIRTGSAANAPFIKEKKEPPMPRAELIDEQEIISKKPITLNKSIMNIGRDPDRDISIPKETVSALHATIKYEGNYFYLEDQRSSNRTYLNGREIDSNKPIRLKSGDKIAFDIYRFKLHLPNQIPVGGTVLSKRKIQPEGTVLRSQKKEKDIIEPKPDNKEEDKIKEPENSNDTNKPPSVETKDFTPEKRTQLKSGMCPNHPARKASDLCPICKKPFCSTCITEKYGKVICLSCAEKK